MARLDRAGELVSVISDPHMAFLYVSEWLRPSDTILVLDGDTDRILQDGDAAAQ